ncbi:MULTISPECIES: LppM family (lipo)protein [Glutamicibacter]|uniref:DUF3153 domain-containing protein n=1 Tax=Glutamicibacter halophytocola TaxID=1933880 RepID=A0A5B8I499_9MICC|nr:MULTISPECIES: DUF3153 domain-containing protein [Glutamicibacter]MBF6670954.1 DUF3153 domain-containing protein [Glutamicibacter sp. FBE19]NQD39851.1 DUF3153 domain-containing protein [Glutamicibacter halophytocola]QDY67875.1 DUF3153 domain-containing protein [Glutamicibacter halophytocola]UUX60055.1 DUF3153 domain-containing protein [Glutamicibacter halophytocola]
MKRLLSVIALVFTAVLALSGCVNMNAEVNVQGQDKTTGAVEVTMNKENLQGMSLDELLASQVDTAAMEQQIGGKWTYSKIEEGENVGLRFETDGVKTYTQLKDAFKVFGFEINLADDGKEVTFSMPGDKAAVDSSFTEANLHVNFPGEVTSHAPGEVEHHTVTFDMIQGAPVYQATGKFDHSLFYSAIFGGAILVLTLVFVLAFAPKGAKEAH